MSAGPPTIIAPPLQRLVSCLAGWLAVATQARPVSLENKTHPRIIFAHIPQFVGFFDMVGNGGVWHKQPSERVKKVSKQQDEFQFESALSTQNRAS